MITTCRLRSGGGAKIGCVIHVVTYRKVLGGGRECGNGMRALMERVRARDVGRLTSSNGNGLQKMMSVRVACGLPIFGNGVDEEDLRERGNRECELGGLGRMDSERGVSERVSWWQRLAEIRGSKIAGVMIILVYILRLSLKP